MVDNSHNLFKSAPDKGELIQTSKTTGPKMPSVWLTDALPNSGTQDGPVWGEWETLENYLAHVGRNSTPENLTARGTASLENKLKHRQGGGFWLTELGPLGKVSRATSTSPTPTNREANYYCTGTTSGVELYILAECQRLWSNRRWNC